MRYVLRHPDDTRPSLLVQTIPAIDDAPIESFKAEMYGVRCANGIVFAPDECVILRDSFSSMDAASIHVESRLPTAKVLESIAPRASEAFDARVERWLRRMSESWQSAIPADAAVASEFFQDIVPAASGSLLST